MSENLNNNNLRNWQLKLGYWYVSNKLRLKKALIIGLITINIGLFGYSIIASVVILVIQGQTYQEMMNQLDKNLIDYDYFREKNKPQELDFQSIDIIPTTGERFDMVAQVTNPNKKWMVDYISYQFVSGDEVLGEGRTFIFPEEDKFLLALGVEGTVKASNVELRYTEIGWQRVHNFEDEYSKKFKFLVKDVEFLTGRTAGISSRASVSQSRFLITNDSAYNFWQIGIYTVLYSGSSVVGISYSTLDEFLSSQTKQISVNWFESLRKITRTKVMPEVNIYDESVYIK